MHKAQRTPAGPAQPRLVEEYASAHKAKVERTTRWIWTWPEHSPAFHTPSIISL